MDGKLYSALQLIHLNEYEHGHTLNFNIPLSQFLTLFCFLFPVLRLYNMRQLYLISRFLFPSFFYFLSHGNNVQTAYNYFKKDHNVVHDFYYFFFQFVNISEQPYWNVYTFIMQNIQLSIHRFFIFFSKRINKHFLMLCLSARIRNLSRINFFQNKIILVWVDLLGPKSYESTSCRIFWSQKEGTLTSKKGDGTLSRIKNLTWGYISLFLHKIGGWEFNNFWSISMISIISNRAEKWLRAKLFRTMKGIFQNTALQPPTSQTPQEDPTVSKLGINMKSNSTCLSFYSSWIADQKYFNFIYHSETIIGAQSEKKFGNNLKIFFVKKFSRKLKKRCYFQKLKKKFTFPNIWILRKSIRILSKRFFSRNGPKQLKKSWNVKKTQFWCTFRYVCRRAVRRRRPSVRTHDNFQTHSPIEPKILPQVWAHLT